MPTLPNNFHFNKNRIEALSDAVFAIALTILVLELKVPALSRSEAVEHLNEQVAQLRPLFAGYVVTFVIGGIFWYLQCVSFQLIARMTPMLVAINLVFLGLVSLLPFTMSLWSRYQGLALSNVFYFGNFLGISAALSLYWLLAQRQGLISSTASLVDIRRLNRRILSMPVASAIGLAMAFAFPSGAIYVFTSIMVISRIWSIAIDRRSSE